MNAPHGNKAQNGYLKVAYTSAQFLSKIMTVYPIFSIQIIDH